MYLYFNPLTLSTKFVIRNSWKSNKYIFNMKKYAYD